MLFKLTDISLRSWALYIKETVVVRLSTGTQFINSFHNLNLEEMNVKNNNQIRAVVTNETM